MKHLQLVLAILLVAVSVPNAGRQVPRLVTAKARSKLDAGERRVAWMYFHAGVLNTSYGVHQIFFRWLRWDRDPLLLASFCYLGSVAV